VKQRRFGVWQAPKRLDRALLVVRLQAIFLLFGHGPPVTG
jgi:hypothetical protein